MLKQVLIACSFAIGFVSTIANAEVDEPTVEAIKALWQSQHKALDAHDTDALMMTYSDSDDIMLMGTGPGEHWIGQEEIKDAYAHFMEGFDAHTMQVECVDGAGSKTDTVVWFTAVCSFTEKKGEEQRSYVLNLSAVAVQEGTDWRFHTMHFSHLTGGE
ncbi:MAG: SgcJ/EcaC family oxidoreductase [Candidatus Competibacteraceae bacterium]|nr:SgcJ/EcaC family oxidoreductase [Candidatus Competibacteraceae bacterium]